MSEAAAGATPADAAADAANVATSAGAPGEAPPGGVGGVALRPILGIGDRSIIGYEVLHRPSLLDWDPLTLLERVLPLAPAVAPGVIMIPVSRVLEPELAKRLVAQATEAGVSSSDIVWLIPAPASPTLDSVRIAQARALLGAGFRLALGGVGLQAIGHPEVVQLRPDFVVLDQAVVRRVEADQAARATVAGLLAFFGRLGGRVVARGVDDEPSARVLVEVGVQLGMGSHLEGPVVLDPAFAEPGDRVVSRAFFADRAVRVLGRRAEPELLTPFSSLPLPAGAADDREFARILSDAARRLQAEHDTQRILEVVAEMLPLAVPVDRLAIFEADWEGYRMRPRIVVGEGLEGLKNLDDSIDSGITGWVFLRGRPYNCPDTFAHSEAAHVPGSVPGRADESLVVVPLVAGDHRLGVLDAWRDGINAFNDDDVERCELLGYLAAAAWRNAQLYTELERRAVTDTLTGLLNTRWWDELAPREAAQAMRAGTHIAVLLVDLDHFKRINDTLGHATGDVVLRNAARVLAKAVRAGDAAVRYGGDEFLLVLHNGDEAGAVRVAESVRSSMSLLPAPSEELGAVTASIGIALFPGDGETLQDVVRAADRAMYQAKAAGRDRVQLFADR